VDVLSNQNADGDGANVERNMNDRSANQSGAQRKGARMSVNEGSDVTDQRRERTTSHSIRPHEPLLAPEHQEDLRLGRTLGPGYTVWMNTFRPPTFRIRSHKLIHWRMH
jgi:hypothetical protein